VPWFPARPPPPPPKPRAASASPRDDSDVDDDAGIPGLPLADSDAGAEEVFPEYHSALTTVLLDDSPLKARLQPWNHVCLKEYVQATRNQDLKALELQELRKLWEQRQEQMQKEQEQERASAAAEEHALREAGPPAVQEDGGAQAPATPKSPPSEGAAEDARSPPPTDGEGKKRKRASKKEKREAELMARFAGAEAPPAEEAAEFDPTLLAVVGVMDAVKWESNVAAWIREGGLWGPFRRTAEVPAPHEPDEARDDAMVETEAEAGAEAGQSAEGAGETVLVPGNDADPLPSAETPQEATGDAAAPMWFEDPEVVRYWADRGRQACAAIGVEVAHGIEG
jgi:hypothetical protein